MMDNVPSMAPISPPLTGASSMAAPRSWRRGGQPARGRRRDRAHVDDDAVRAGSRRTRRRARRAPLDIGPVGQHRDDARGLRATSAGDSRARRAGRHDRVDRRAAAAVDDQRKAALEQIFCNRVAFRRGLARFFSRPRPLWAISAAVNRNVAEPGEIAACRALRNPVERAGCYDSLFGAPTDATAAAEADVSTSGQEAEASLVRDAANLDKPTAERSSMAISAGA